MRLGWPPMDSRSRAGVVMPMPPPPSPCPPPTGPPPPAYIRNSGEFGNSKVAGNQEPGIIGSFFASLFGKKVSRAAAKRNTKADSDDDDAYFPDVDSELSTHKQHRVLQSFKMTKAMVPTRSVLKTSKSNVSSLADDIARADSHATTQSDFVQGFSRDSIPSDDRAAFLHRSSAKSTDSDGPASSKSSRSQRRVVCVLPDEMPSSDERDARACSPLHRSATAPAAQPLSASPDSPAVRPSRLSHSSASSFAVALDSVMGAAPHPTVKGPNSPAQYNTTLSPPSSHRTPTSVTLLPPSPQLHGRVPYASQSYEPNVLLATASLPCVVPPSALKYPSTNQAARPLRLPQQVQIAFDFDASGESLQGEGQRDSGVPSLASLLGAAGRRDVNTLGRAAPPDDATHVEVFIRDLQLPKGGARGASGSSPSVHANGHSAGQSVTGQAASVDLDVFLRAPDAARAVGSKGDSYEMAKRAVVANTPFDFRFAAGRHSEPGLDPALAAAAGGSAPLHGRRSEQGHAGLRDAGREDDDVHVVRKPRPTATAAAFGGAATVAWVATGAPGLAKWSGPTSQVGVRL